MGVYIKGMDMPTGNDELRLIIHSNGQVIISHKTHCEEAEAVPVPPHGDLIDRNAAYDKIAEQEGGNYVDMDAVGMGLSETPVIIEAEEKGENFCADCHWYEAEEQYCFRNGCHAYNESTCELWEPVPADEPIPAPGGKTAPATYDLLYEEGGYNSNGV